MIESKDRSGWFGASDVDKIVGNWKTKTWMDWWMIKLGIRQCNFANEATLAGTHWEHKILDSLDIPDMQTDEQIIIPELLLRVNLDGSTKSKIYEVKSHKAEKAYKKPKNHRQQVQVQMFAKSVKEAEIVSYGLISEEYKNFFLPVDAERRKEHPVEYDLEFIEGLFLPRITILADCLRRGEIPDEAIG